MVASVCDVVSILPSLYTLWSHSGVCRITAECLVARKVGMQHSLVVNRSGLQSGRHVTGGKGIYQK